MSWMEILETAGNSSTNAHQIPMTKKRTTRLHKNNSQIIPVDKIPPSHLYLRSVTFKKITEDKEIVQNEKRSTSWNVK